MVWMQIAGYYPELNNFSIVLQDDVLRFTEDFRMPLSALPVAEVNYFYDIGNDGENENQSDKSFISEMVGKLKSYVNPKNGNLSVTVGPNVGGDLSINCGVTGCLNFTMMRTYNGFNLEYQAPTGNGWTSVIDERVSYSTENNSLTYHNSSGSKFNFNPVYTNDIDFEGNFYPPPTMDWNAKINSQASSDKRYELTSKIL